MARRALVFGGTGWVGHHIVLQLRRAGFAVTAVARGQKRDFVDQLPDDARLLRGDKNDADFVRQALALPHAVVVDSVPSEASIQNILACGERVGRYIHCSSTGGYAPLTLIPADETHAYPSDYGSGWAQKRIVDNLVLELCRVKGFPATVLRPSYITGPGAWPLCNLGGRRKDFVDDLLAERAVDLPNDGLALLHPIHVEDLARAFALAAVRPRTVGEVYNICLDRAVTLNDYVALNARALGREARVNHVPLAAMQEKYAGVANRTGLDFVATHMCFDIAKARRDLDYHPSRTTPEAIGETARWAARANGHAGFDD